MVVAGCLVEDTTAGRVRVLPGIGPVIQYRLRDRDAQRLVRGLSHTAEAMFAAGARRVLLPIEGVAQPLAADAARSVLRGPVRRAALRLFTVHAMGTARMSSDPGRGVVDSFGELHGATGVFVGDASVLPGPVGVNPMETIVALAARNAERLIEHRTRYRI
jgi:choline dehydrogenase-like flavoprotein